jgi:hypothetical protein
LPLPNLDGQFVSVVNISDQPTPTTWPAGKSAPRSENRQFLQAGALPRSGPLAAPPGRFLYLVGNMSDNAFPDTYLAELMRSNSALISALAMLCVERRKQIRKLESELQQMRASARPLFSGVE